MVRTIYKNKHLFSLMSIITKIIYSKLTPYNNYYLILQLNDGKKYDGYYLFEPEIGDIIEGTINKTNKDKDKIRFI